MAKQAVVSKKNTKKPVVRDTKSTVVAKEVAAVKTPAKKVAEHTSPINTKPVSFAARFNRHLTPQALVAEAIGTFILAVVALTVTAVLAPLYVGLTLVVLAIIIGGISGAHANPAVTFGLWTARKFPGFALPFYWLAQILGGLAALVAISAFTGKGLGLTLNSFLSFNWGVFAIEVIGTAIFLFGLTAANSRTGLTLLGRSMGVGLSLFAALTVTAGLYAKLNSSIDLSSVTSVEQVPRAYRVSGPNSSGASLNPAIALGQKELTDDQVTSSGSGAGSTGSGNASSRLTLGETIVGTLLGAAIGANLYRLLGRREQGEDVLAESAEARQR